MIIKKINIEKFRDIHNTEFMLGKYITAIAGRNGSMKSTLLGIIGQTFTIPPEGHPLSGITTIDGFAFKSQFSEMFRFSSNETAEDHKWTTYFYNRIYKESTFTCKSIFRNKSTKSLRFWNALGRGVGTGFPNVPVYFLSLSRLSPIGEVKHFKRESPQLSEEEVDFFVKHHKDILCNTSPCKATVGMRNSSKKLFSGLETDTYDVNSNSAGEDNVGKIILSILSFKRIKKLFPKDYRGGILLIDELDAAVFPYSQKKLVNFLYEQAKEINLQVVFTTHSPYVLKTVMSLKEYDNNEDLKNEHILPNRSILYLTRKYDAMNHSMYVDIQEIRKKIELRNCLSDIKLEPFSPDTINVYLEDNSAMRFFKFLIGDTYARYINLIDVNLGWTNYFDLHKRNIPEFKKNSIIILDHDVISNKISGSPVYSEYYYNEKTDTSNILFLPIDIEKGFYDMLKNRDIYAFFESFTNLQYDVCFRDYIFIDNDDTLSYKHWYNDVLNMINQNEQAFYLTWKKYHEKEYSTFIDDFKSAYNNRAKELDLDEISE